MRDAQPVNSIISVRKLMGEEGRRLVHLTACKLRTQNPLYCLN